ncbi:hypothetical protein OAB57_00170 [Bacteriovoracaceae bacterium]|nr:hypothetical protein [Bacteriovoracaceae bacterium]
MNQQRIDTEFSVLIDTIKTISKNKKISHQKIAEYLDISIDSLRQIFSKRSCSLKRFISLCQSVGMTIDEVTKVSKYSKEDVFEFSKKQLSFFESNLSCFFFFSELYIVGRSFESVGGPDLTHESKLQYLRELEDLKIVKLELDTTDLFKFTIKGHFYLDFESKLFHIVTEKMPAEFMHKIAKKSLFDKKKHDDDFLFKFNHVRLTQDTSKDFIDELNNVVKKYVARSTLEHKSLSDDDLIPMTFCVGCISNIENHFTIPNYTSVNKQKAS